MRADSSLVTHVIPAHSGNFWQGRRGITITDITIHHAAGNITVPNLGTMWQRVGLQVSSHYGINGKDIGQYVLEADTAFTNGNQDSNLRSVTIEVANTVSGNEAGERAGWPVSEESLDSLISLVADIAIRNNLLPLQVGQNLTYHSMFRPTVCPGPFLMSRFQMIADRANAIIAEDSATSSGMLYGVARQVIALSDRAKAEAFAAQLNAAREDPNLSFYYVIERPRT